MFATLKIVAAGAAAFVSLSAFAHGFSCGDLKIQHPFAYPSVGQSKVGGVFFKAIQNTGAKDDQLLSAKGDVSDVVQIHEMSMQDNVMKMREVSNVVIAAGQTVPFISGQGNGNHVMLMNLKQPLKVGDKFPLSLQFQNAGACSVEVYVEERNTTMKPHH